MRRVSETLRCSEQQAFSLVLATGVVLGAGLIGLPTVIGADAPTEPIAMPTSRPHGGGPAIFETTPAFSTSDPPPLPPLTELEQTATTATTPAPPSAPEVAAAPDIPRAAIDFLRVTETGWAAPETTVALAAATIPEGGLPVAAVAGEEDKRSYLRLSGGGTHLRLALHSDPGSAVLEELAGLRACPVTTGDWTGRPAMKLERAPKIDCSLRAPGRRQRDGTYLFDLSSFADRARANGIALAPTKGDGRTFQVVFAVIDDDNAAR